MPFVKLIVMRVHLRIYMRTRPVTFAMHKSESKRARFLHQMHLNCITYNNIVANGTAKKAQ